MFSTKSKIDQDSGLVTSKDNDLIVHNMPSATGFGKFSSSKTASPSGFKASNNSHGNSKLIGLIIIIGGLMVIGTLAYLSYIFIIKSALGPKQSTESKFATSSQINSNQKDKKILSAVKVITKVATTSSLNSNLISTGQSSSSSILSSSSTVLKIGSNSLVINSKDQKINNLSPLLDSDSDGLNNLEELAFGTSASSSDTNNNGYPDLLEIKTNHNPIGTGTLSADTSLAIYHNKAFNYQILYPKSWLISLVNKGETTIFNAPDNSLIQVSVQDNTGHSDILTWYQQLFPNLKPVAKQIKNTVTWSGIKGADGLSFYLTDRKHTHVFVISYIPAISGRLVYPHLFKAMINSLVID